MTEHLSALCAQYLGRRAKKVLDHALVPRASHAPGRPLAEVDPGLVVGDMRIQTIRHSRTYANTRPRSLQISTQDDGGSNFSADRSASTEGLLAVPLASFRSALVAHSGDGLSEHTSDVLKMLCAEARRLGVAPERLIILVKGEISLRHPGMDETELQRAKIEEAVITCIRSFYATANPPA